MCHFVMLLLISRAFYYDTWSVMSKGKPTFPTYNTSSSRNASVVSLRASSMVNLHLLHFLFLKGAHSTVYRTSFFLFFFFFSFPAHIYVSRMGHDGNDVCWGSRWWLEFKGSGVAWDFQQLFLSIGPCFHRTSGILFYPSLARRRYKKGVGIWALSLSMDLLFSSWRLMHIANRGTRAFMRHYNVRLRHTSASCIYLFPIFASLSPQDPQCGKAVIPIP